MGNKEMGVELCRTKSLFDIVDIHVQYFLRSAVGLFRESETK